MTTGTPREPDLALARSQVQAVIAGSAMSTRPPSATADSPLTFLAPETELTLAKRAASGIAPSSSTFPRRRVLTRTVLPSAALALVDAALFGVALGAGNTVLAVVAAVLFVPLAALAAGGARFAAQDPLRLTAGEVRAVAAARHWQSSRDWGPPLAGSVERGLVVAAADAATRIARTPFWRSGQIENVQVHLDLRAELDAVDAEAHRIATAGRDEREAAAWARVVDRVAALTAYANQVDGYEARRAATLAREQDAPTDAELLSGLAAENPSEDELVALLVYLNATLPG